LSNQNLSYTDHINFNKENYEISVHPLLTKGIVTVEIKNNNEIFWISIQLTALENKYFNYKQLNVNYNNYIFTRGAEKKNKDDKEIIWARNIDRSIRPYIPDHYPFNISIEAWNLSISDNDPTIALMLGCNAGLLSLNIINAMIMPININEEFLTQLLSFPNSDALKNSILKTLVEILKNSSLLVKLLAPFFQLIVLKCAWNLFCF
jgi:polyribonucleotide nucleotidyltransferase